MKHRMLAGHVLKALKLVFAFFDFRLHVLADGIRKLLYSQTLG